MRDQAGGTAPDDWFATLDAVLNPAAVAVLGASRDPAKTGGRILHSIRNGGYQGRVIAVNPRYESVGGWPCVPSVADIGDPVPEVAYIALPRETAIEQVTDCGRAGIRGCIVVGTGFGEDSASGRKLEDRLAEAAATAGVRLIGPNCLGFISSRVSLNLEAAITLQSPAQPGPVGIISQSGSLMLCIYHGIADAGSGISFAVSVGNQVDLAVPELMRYGALDLSTSVLAIYAESLGDADEFLGAAALCQETGTRVLILKTGASGVGADVTASHTAAIVGSRGAFEAACRSVGVLVADDIDIMAEAAAALTRWPVPEPKSVAVMSSSGGGAAVLADRLDSAGLEIATLRPGTVSSIALTLNPIGRSAVIDFGRRQEGRPPLDSAALCNTLMADPGVGAGLFSLTVTPAMTERCEAIVAAAHEQGKLIVATMFPGSATGDCMKVLRAGDIPCLPHIDSAVRLLKLLWQAGPSRPDRVRKIGERTARRRPAAGTRLPWLPVDEAMALLDRYGIPCPPGSLATSKEEAVARATELGFPVAMKIADPALVHKSDAGGVILNVADAGAVAASWDLIAERAGGRGLRRESACYLQKMAGGVAELLLSVRTDPQFGSVLTVGAGGLLAELIGDVQVRRLPVTSGTAREMLADLAIWPVLNGYRGGAVADVRAAVTAMTAVSRLAARLGAGLAELEINPLIVGAAGAGATAVDARVRLGRT
jgi:acyl-CoA synthetase (NDP forming)